MIEDIISDSNKISESLLKTQKQELGLDSLSFTFNDLPFTDSSIKNMYFLMLKYATNVYQVHFTKRTISQLRNSGGMRLMPNKISANVITEYSELVDKVETQGDYYTKSGVAEIIKLNHKLFRLKYIQGIHPQNIDELFKKSKFVALASYNQELLIEYANIVYFTSEVLHLYNQELQAIQAQIPKTIAILRKENHL
jgi:hypothetical protein